MNSILTPAGCLLLLLALTGLASAQLKTGSNPTSVAATSNFEVEATNGNKFIIGKATGAMTFIDGNQGAGKVLTSDANGLAAWAPANQLSSIAITSLTSPSTYATGTMVYNTATGVDGVPVGPSVWTGSKWVPIGSQNTSSTITVSGSYSSGYDLTGLSTATVQIGTGTGAGNWDTSYITYSAGSVSSESSINPISGTDTKEDTLSEVDVTTAMMNTAIASLPTEGGIIRFRLPAITQPNHPNAQLVDYPMAIDFALPSAAANLGKVFYLMLDVSADSQYAFASGYQQILKYGYVVCQAGERPLVSKGVSTHYSGTDYYNIDSTITRRDAGSVTVTKPQTSHVLKVYPLNSTSWMIESGLGSYVRF